MMAPDDLYDRFIEGFPRRKFSAGLLISFIDLFLDLDVPSLSASGLDGVLAEYPRQEFLAPGRRTNTLIVARADGRPVSLRPFYNAAERFFRAENKRFDYPSCAPHATQAWQDYRDWLDALSTYSAGELQALRKRVADHVLDTLESHEFDPGSIRTEPPPFRSLLEGFDMKARRNEPTGAAFQGMVFGFLRADNPHLQIEIDKVRTGSRRLQRVGDIDGWEGARLAITAEVKQYLFCVDGVPDIEGFANEATRRGAIGMFVALEFAAGARQAIEALGLKALGVSDLLGIVDLWDPVKQRTAVSSFVYYVKHVEKNASLGRRLDVFLREAGFDVADRPDPT